MCDTLGEKEILMSEIEQEEQAQQGITLPIEWHVPDNIQNRYVHNLIVQPGKYELTLFFFETQIPPSTSKKTSGTTDPFLRIVPSSGTLRVPTKSAMKASSIAGPAEAYVAVAETIVREARTTYLHTPGLPEIGDDYSDEEELKWRAFFARSDVQAELERLAEEAEREFAAGETEEGGFAIE